MRCAMWCVASDATRRIACGNGALFWVELQQNCLAVGIAPLWGSRRVLESLWGRESEVKKVSKGMTQKRLGGDIGAQTELKIDILLGLYSNLLVA